MERKIYISDDVICLSEYIDQVDDLDCYNCWNDEETQNGYNINFTKSFDEWVRETEIKSRFIATVIRHSDGACVGSIFLSPIDTPPDLAFMIYKPYRKQGYGTRAFMLGIKYCFEVLKLDKIFAGCYKLNSSSWKIIERCGFIPHPQGNMQDKHRLTGEDITQFDFVRHNSQM